MMSHTENTVLFTKDYLMSPNSFRLLDEMLCRSLAGLV